MHDDGDDLAVLGERGAIAVQFARQRVGMAFGVHPAVVERVQDLERAIPERCGEQLSELARSRRRRHLDDHAREPRSHPGGGQALPSDTGGDRQQRAAPGKPQALVDAVDRRVPAREVVGVAGDDHAEKRDARHYDRCDRAPASDAAAPQAPDRERPGRGQRDGAAPQSPALQRFCDARGIDEQREVGGA